MASATASSSIREDGIRSELWVYVALDAPVKFIGAEGAQRVGPIAQALRDRLRGMGAGRSAAKIGDACVTETGPEERRASSRAIPTTRSSPAASPSSTWTRRLGPSAATALSFSGATARLRNPAAMTRSRLSGKVGAGLDPCGAIQVPFELAAGQEREIVFRLGVGRDAEDARNLVRRFRGSAAARERARSGLAILEAHARRGAGGDAGSVAQRA